MTSTVRFYLDGKQREMAEVVGSDGMSWIGLVSDMSPDARQLFRRQYAAFKVKDNPPAPVEANPNAPRKSKTRAKK